MCYDLFLLERRMAKLAYRYARTFNHSDFNVRLGDFEKAMPRFPKTVTQEEAEQIQEFLEMELREVALNTYFKLSGFEHKPMPIICFEGIYYALWGLIPRWLRGVVFWDNTLNTVSEKVYETPSFKHLPEKNRCLIPVSGFFESRHVGKDKYPYKITSPDQEIMSLAGLYDDWVDPESSETVRTFTILTTEANPLMAQIHNSKLRMPLIIAPDDEARWLDPTLSKEEVKAMMKPYTGKLIAHTISQDANSRDEEKRNLPTNLEPVLYDIPELIY